MAKTCSAINPENGCPCGFPEGHFPAYQHGNGTKTKSWGFGTTPKVPQEVKDNILTEGGSSK